MTDMMHVDEFDRTGEAATEEEIKELLVFCDDHHPNLAKELRESIATAPTDYPHLLRFLVDDMRRFQAGREPRYTPYI